MERRITLNDNSIKKKNDNNYLENNSNEKQNSLASGIRIGFAIDFSLKKKQ